MAVTVYSTPSCGWCQKTKEYLDSKNVKYESIDVSENQEAANRMIKISGQMGVPVTDINGTVIIGFNKEKLDKALESVKSE